ncbi:MAG TPA: hypothetical protein VGS09_02475 [Actinomycetota bacterium]|jgi:hypothetical protein|nr:hypothetical protein [Actinomycetota bacterium]
MLTVAILAAAGRGGYGDFIAGLLIGAGIGFLLGPAARSWLIHREWAEASRRARLTDEVLARMEEDAHQDLDRHDNRRTQRPWRP